MSASTYAARPPRTPLSEEGLPRRRDGPVSRWSPRWEVWIPSFGETERDALLFVAGNAEEAARKHARELVEGDPDMLDKFTPGPVVAMVRGRDGSLTRVLVSAAVRTIWHAKKEPST